MVHRDAAAAAGTDDNAEYGRCPRARAVYRLREGEAVGIVRHPYRLTELPHQVMTQVVAVEHQTVTVFNQAALRVDSPRQADAQSKRPFAPVADGRNQSEQLLHKRLIALFMRRTALAIDAFARRVEQDGFHFGAANV